MARCIGGSSVVEIPDGTTRIYHGAFRGNADVREVHIPASATTINEYAFARCSALREVCFEGGVPAIDSTVFADCNAIARVTVNEGGTIYNLPRHMRTLALQAQGTNNVARARRLLSTHLCNASNAAKAPHDKRPIVNFGSYHWQVIETQDNRLLLLADSEVDCRRFNGRNDIWRNSKVRTYLNVLFLANSFSDVERAVIDKTTLLTDGTKTDDCVFLLSLEEVTEFLPIECDRILHTTARRSGSWWLRSGAERFRSNELEPGALNAA